MISHLFTAVDESAEEYEYTIKASYIEIYQEKIRDLLDGVIVSPLYILSITILASSLSHFLCIPPSHTPINSSFSTKIQSRSP